MYRLLYSLNACLVWGLKHLRTIRICMVNLFHCSTRSAVDAVSVDCTSPRVCNSSLFFWISLCFLRRKQPNCEEMVGEGWVGGTCKHTGNRKREGGGEGGEQRKAREKKDSSISGRWMGRWKLMLEEELFENWVVMREYYSRFRYKTLVIQITFSKPTCQHLIHGWLTYHPEHSCQYTNEERCSNDRHHNHPPLNIIIITVIILCNDIHGWDDGDHGLEDEQRILQNHINHSSFRQLILVGTSYNTNSWFVT